ncbi:MAG: polysaccharide biosynthesis/export family protein [Bacteroidota bacterium]
MKSILKKDPFNRLLDVILVLGAIIFIQYGCVSRKKTIIYQDVIQDTSLFVRPSSEYLVQEGDVLYVKVQSLDEKASAFVNGTIGEQTANELNNSEQYLYFSGYEVGPKGTIRLPYLDSLKVIGMTTDQIAFMLNDSLKPFIKEALVTVKLAGFRVCVYGEVQNAGTFLFYHSRVTIFDVVALAKPTEYYNAKNVVITRQMGGNKIKIARIDLTSSKILTSPYYFLQPNDQIYIEPLKVKKYGFNTFPYALLLSTLSTIMLIYSIFK